MADRISETLQQKISARLSFYEDIGIDLFYRDRTSVLRTVTPVAAVPTVAPREYLPAEAAEPRESVFDGDESLATVEISESIAAPANSFS